MSHHKPSVRTAMQLWRESDLPFARKLATACVNELRKVRRLKPCCGHPGEPGC